MAMADRMLDVVASVPTGSVVTYGDVAAAAGSRSARLAGRVLSDLSDASTPWHRVVRADGSIVPHLLARQAALLAAEGVSVVNGRVNLRAHRHRW